ncbi:MAG TPA: SGNH/GDSL hydrolase family protein [Acidimicrobiales bacterium]|nr:SGNH/GDSL hydrolase family protein [Acidimicrobiales bacterium]
MKRGAPLAVWIFVVGSLAGACQSDGGRRQDLLRYVSLGDSFPAGEGLPRASGPCRRSPLAYPNLLAQRTNLLPSLHACSGATTEDVLERAPASGEGRQLDWLAPDTEVVTVTIGGNDAGFGRVVGACLSGLHPCSRLDAEVGARIAALRARLDAVHGEIRRRLPRARLLVVGYPQLVGDPAHVPLDGCPELGLSPTARITGEEARWLRDQGRALDAVMRESAQAAGGRYVDAASVFAGHEVCTPAPWMTGVVEDDIRTSFHPNVAGHEALARLVAAELARR